jgi:uncharacterized protein YdcH (DUF465 family)
MDPGAGLIESEVCRMASAVREELLASNDEFRRLSQEHSQYSQRLDGLTQKRFLSEDEKIEEVRLKKLKLRLKDEMEKLELQYREQHNNVA